MSEPEKKSKAAELGQIIAGERCVLCGGQDLMAKCETGQHLVCPVCYRAYTRAFEKLEILDSCVCPEDGCGGRLIKTEAVVAQASGARLLLLKQSDAEHRTVAEKFGKTINPKCILSIYRVDNPPLKGIFEACKSRMEKETRYFEGKDIGANEKLLFHATTRAACGGIVREGFDMRRGGQAHGQAHGPGAYFAADAYVSHGYSKLDGRSQRCMLLCRVLLGATGRDSKASGGIFVINREQQLLPTYMIIYKIDS